MPRPKRQRRLQSPPVGYGFRPIRQNLDEEKGVQLLFEEYESIRLADYEGMSQEEASEIMNISRPTFTRIYDSARAKVAKALVDNLLLNVAGGDVKFDHEWFRCLNCDTTFRESADNNGKYCPVCKSDKIEHINGTLHQPVRRAEAPKAVQDDLGFCICPACGGKQQHLAGIPCKSIFCQKCHVHLIRENSAHHFNIKQIKNNQNTK